MFTNTLVRRAAVGLLVFAAACGDDNKHGSDTDNATEADGQVRDAGPGVVRNDGGAASDLDAGRGLDGGGSVSNDDAGATSTTSDGAVSAPGDTLDASAPNESVADAATASGDAASATDDAGAADAGNAADAGSAAEAGSSADAGSCPINDPRYGCGREVSPTWVRFDNGLEVDRVSGLGWTPVRTLGTTAPDIENQTYCLGLDFVGSGDWDVPEIDAVRTLGAGCSKTVPGGACPVSEMLQEPVTDGSCTCDAATGQAPSAAGFCRPELTTCDTIWSRTWCGPNGPVCNSYEHWFYDVTNGSVVLRPYGQEPDNVKGRCVTKLLPPLP